MQKILLLLALPLFPAFCFAEKQLGLSEDCATRLGPNLDKIGVFYKVVANLKGNLKCSFLYETDINPRGYRPGESNDSKNLSGHRPGTGG